MLFCLPSRPRLVWGFVFLALKIHLWEVSSPPTLVSGNLVCKVAQINSDSFV